MMLMHVQTQITLMMTVTTNQPECTALHIALLCQAGGDNESNQKYQEEVYLADIQKNDQFDDTNRFGNLSKLLLQKNNAPVFNEGDRYVEYQRNNDGRGESYVQLLIKERVKHGMSRTVSSWKLMNCDGVPGATSFLPLASNGGGCMFGLFQLMGDFVNDLIGKNEALEQECDMVRTSMHEWKTTAESLSKKYWKDREDELLENFVRLLNQKKAEIVKLKCELSAEKERKQVMQPQPTILKRPLENLYNELGESKDSPIWDPDDIDNLAHGRRVSNVKKGRKAANLRLPTNVSNDDDFKPRTNPLTGVKELSSAKQAFENDDDDNNSVTSDPLL